MSILIKGAKMPKVCNAKCPVSALFCNLWKESTGEHIPADCPLIELPDHGDLIDRDELLKRAVFMPRGGVNLPLMYMSYVKAAKAIIPAERSEE